MTQDYNFILNLFFSVSTYLLERMVDKFGDCCGLPGPQGKRGQQGEVGPPGKKGKDGEKGASGLFDFCRWFGPDMLRLIRKNGDCSYYFDTEKDFIMKEKKIAGFKTHSDRKLNAESRKTSVKKVKLDPGHGFGVTFKDSLFEINDITSLALSGYSYSLLVITFKMDESPLKEEFIISDKELFRGLSIDSESLNIYGATERPLKLKYIPGKWITIGIQWTCYNNNRQGYYFLSQEITPEMGTFTTAKIKKESRKEKLYLGALYDGRQSWSGCLAVLDIIHIYEPQEKKYPEHFMSLIVADHCMRVNGYD